MTHHATDDMENRDHPAETALAAWVDEQSGDAALAGHLAVCALCRDRVASLERVVEAVAADPAPLEPAAAAASRARITAAIATRATVHPMKRTAHHSFRIWWIPTAAAAGLALFLVLRGAETERAPVAEATGPAPPVVALAEEAAEEIAVALEAEPSETGTGAEAQIMALDVAAEPLPGAVISDYTIVEEFESLEPEDQEAVLMELAASEFQL